MYSYARVSPTLSVIVAPSGEIQDLLGSGKGLQTKDCVRSEPRYPLQPNQAALLCISSQLLVFEGSGVQNSPPSFPLPSGYAVMIMFPASAGSVAQSFLAPTPRAQVATAMSLAGNIVTNVTLDAKSLALEELLRHYSTRGPSHPLNSC